MPESGGNGGGLYGSPNGQFEAVDEQPSQMADGMAGAMHSSEQREMTSVPFVYDLRGLQDAQIPLYIGERLPAIQPGSRKNGKNHGPVPGAPNGFVAVPVRGGAMILAQANARSRKVSAAFEKDKADKTRESHRRYGRRRDKLQPTSKKSTL